MILLRFPTGQCWLHTFLSHCGPCILTGCLSVLGPLGAKIAIKVTPP